MCTHRGACRSWAIAHNVQWNASLLQVLSVPESSVPTSPLLSVYISGCNRFCPLFWGHFQTLLVASFGLNYPPKHVAKGGPLSAMMEVSPSSAGTSSPEFPPWLWPQPLSHLFIWGAQWPASPGHREPLLPATQHVLPPPPSLACGCTAPPTPHHVSPSLVGGWPLPLHQPLAIPSPGIFLSPVAPMGLALC